MKNAYIVDLKDTKRIMSKLYNMNYPVPKQEYKVLVRCFTYNQSKYIEDALNGFAMQQTNFPFACIVMDDASTDGEQEVIKVWMERECDMSKAETIDIPTSVVIIVPHKINVSCSFAFYLLKQNLYKKKEEKMRHVTPWREKCEYEAMCEGDDYWIDPLKLQKQVDFLEENPEYGIVRTNVHSYIQKEGRLEENFFSHGKLTKIKDTYHDYIIHGWFAAPCTWMYRTKFMAKHVPLNEKDCFTGDIALLLCITQDSKIKYFLESTAVYRVLEKSASHFDNPKLAWRFFVKNKNTRIYFAKKENFIFRFKCWLKISYNYLKILKSLKAPSLLHSWFINTISDLPKLLLKK